MDSTVITDTPADSDSDTTIQLDGYGQPEALAETTQFTRPCQVLQNSELRPPQCQSNDARHQYDRWSVAHRSILEMKSACNIKHQGKRTRMGRDRMFAQLKDEPLLRFQTCCGVATRSRSLTGCTKKEVVKEWQPGAPQLLTWTRIIPDVHDSAQLRLVGKFRSLR